MATRTTKCRAGDLKRAVKTGDLNKVAGETHRVNRLKTECALYGASTCFTSFCLELGSTQWTSGIDSHRIPTKISRHYFKIRTISYNEW